MHYFDHSSLVVTKVLRFNNLRELCSPIRAWVFFTACWIHDLNNLYSPSSFKLICFLLNLQLPHLNSPQWGSQCIPICSVLKKFKISLSVLSGVDYKACRETAFRHLEWKGKLVSIWTAVIGHASFEGLNCKSGQVPPKTFPKGPDANFIPSISV